MDNSAARWSKVSVALWVIQVLTAAMFLMAGGKKLAGDEQMVGMFNLIGMGQWFRYVTGSIEVVAAVLLLTPRFAGVGALLLAGTMVGAILTHVLIVGGSFAPSAVLLVLMILVAYGRRERTLGLLK